MSSEFFHFRWGVPDQGYLWESNFKPDEYLGGDPHLNPPFLVKSPKCKELRPYSPLVHEPEEVASPLFIQFSQLDGSPEEVLAFANRYGWMGEPLPLIKEEKVDPKPRLTGESIFQWRKRIGELRHLVEVWEWIKSGDRARLRSITNWDRDGQTVTIKTAKIEQILTRRQDYRPDLYDLIVSGDTVVHLYAARAFLLLNVNKYLRGNASPCLLFADRHRNLSGYIRPHHLLGALWLQFYQAIIGERQVRRCTHCHQWMEIVQGSRTTKVMHDRCVNHKKVMAYRRRQKQARDMANRKLPIKQIAAKLKTDVTTVRKWIS